VEIRTKTGVDHLSGAIEQFIILGRIDIKEIASRRIGLTGKHRKGRNQAKRSKRLLQNNGDVSVA
jgi:hypothetical protein